MHLANQPENLEVNFEEHWSPGSVSFLLKKKSRAIHEEGQIQSEYTANIFKDVMCPVFQKR